MWHALQVTTYDQVWIIVQIICDVNDEEIIEVLTSSCDTLTK